MLLLTRLVLFLSLCAAAFGQSLALLNAMSEELSRNFTILKQKADPPPYFMGYEVTDTEVDVVTASQGSLDSQNHGHQRTLDVTIRAGSPNRSISISRTHSTNGPRASWCSRAAP